MLPRRRTFLLPHARFRRRTTVLGLLAALALTLTPVGGALGASAAGPPSPTVTRTSIVTRDGVSLQAQVAVPATGSLLPLVVIPGTFAGDGVSVDGVAQRLAERGYVTVSYLERGFGDDGELDGGGPNDVADVSDVITWALRRQPVDPQRVGLVGLSYGGGIVLQAAASDVRVKAVAELSGWADMSAAFMPNRTRALRTLQALYGLTLLSPHPGGETLAAFADGIAHEDPQLARRYTTARSVTTVRDRLVANHPALFMCHEMNETVFPVDQSTAFWDSYPGPKRLELWPGDHGSQELLTPLGVVQRTWDDAMRWLDAYVAGTDRSITAEPQVLVVPRSPSGAHAAEAYRGTTVRGTGMAGRTSRLHLMSAPSPWSAGTTLSPTGPGTGSTRLREGTNWLVHTLLPMWTYAQEAVLGTPPSVALPLVDRSVTGIWTGPQASSTVRLRGEAGVHLTLTPSAGCGTVVVHLLDVHGTTGYLVAHQPWSWTRAPVGQQLTADFSLPFNAFDVPRGHRLAVVVTTNDPDFAGLNPPGATVTVGPGSWVDVPLR